MTGHFTSYETRTNHELATTLDLDLVLELGLGDDVVHDGTGRSGASGGPGLVDRAGASGGKSRGGLRTGRKQAVYAPRLNVIRPPIPLDAHEQAILGQPGVPPSGLQRQE
jgi:hypothetical protein